MVENNGHSHSGGGLNLADVFGGYEAQDSHAKILLEPGDDLTALLMRAHLTQEQAMAGAALLYKARIFEDAALRDLIQYVLAASVGIDGRGAYKFLQAIAHVVVAPDGKQHRGFNPFKKKGRDKDDEEMQ